MNKIIRTFTPRNIEEMTTKYPTYNHIIKRIDKNTAYFLMSSESPLTELDFETEDFSELNYPTYNIEDVEFIKAAKKQNIVPFYSPDEDEELYPMDITVVSYNGMIF